MDYNRYFVGKAPAGYLIYDSHRALPLPFCFLGQNYALEICERFNFLGPVEVAEYYYETKIAGNGYNMTYKEFMDKNADMFS